MALIAKKKLSEVGSRPRQKFEITTLLLAPNASESFIIPCGGTAIVIRLGVSAPCMVEVYGTEDHNPIVDPTPYRLLATADHLFDDGSTVLRDGTILKTRQYSIFTNLETPLKPQMYGVLTNTTAQSVAITLSLTYLTVEDL